MENQNREFVHYEHSKGMLACVFKEFAFADPHRNEAYGKASEERGKGEGKNVREKICDIADRRHEQ